LPPSQFICSAGAKLRVDLRRIILWIIRIIRAINDPNDPRNDPSAMTDSAETAVYSAWETRSECPFKVRSVWDSYWSRPGTFHIEMYKQKPEQMPQILQYFAGAKSLQEQRKRAKDSYRLFFDIFLLSNHLVCCDRWSAWPGPKYSLIWTLLLRTSARAT